MECRFLISEQMQSLANHCGIKLRNKTCQDVPLLENVGVVTITLLCSGMCHTTQSLVIPIKVSVVVIHSLCLRSCFWIIVAEHFQEMNKALTVLDLVCRNRKDVIK